MAKPPEDKQAWAKPRLVRVGTIGAVAAEPLPPGKERVGERLPRT